MKRGGGVLRSTIGTALRDPQVRRSAPPPLEIPVLTSLAIRNIF
jgi:hypothetical protein